MACRKKKKTHTPVFAALNQKVQSLDPFSHRCNGETQHCIAKEENKLYILINLNTNYNDCMLEKPVQ